MHNTSNNINNSIWLCVDTLARALDGGREESERKVDELERELKALPRSERDEMRHKIIIIVAGLARLEVRLVGSDER